MTPDVDEPSGLPAAVRWLQRGVAADDLLQHGGIMAVATVGAGGLNYAYQVFMGRALGPEQYAVFGSLFALFYLVTVLGRGIKLSAARFAAELDDPAALSSFHRGLLGRALLVSVGVAGLVALASPAIAGFLGIEEPSLVLVVAAILPFGLALPANLGSLQGRQRFGSLGASRILLAGLKLTLGVGLVLGGYGLYGAFGAMVGSSVLVLAATTVLVRRGLPAAGSRGFDYSRAYRYVLPAVLVGFCLTVPANVDVILVKHFFADRAAGLYTATSVFGKVLVFLPLGIVTALFPKVSHGAALDAADLDDLFDRALLYAGLVAGAGAAVYWLVPRTLLGLVYGPAYTDAAPLLRWYGVAVLAFVLALVALHYQLARDRMGFVYAFTAVSLLEVGVLWLVHPSLVWVVQLLALANGGLLAYGLFTVKVR